MPLLPLRGLVIFPNTVMTIDVARERSINALREAIRDEQRMFVVAQRDSLVEHPALEDMYTVGVLASVKQVLHLPDQTVRVLIEGQTRGMLIDVLEDDGCQHGVVVEIPHIAEAFTDAHERTMMRAIRGLSQQAARARGTNMPELMQAIEGERNPETLCDIVTSNLITRIEDKQAILECTDVDEQLKLVIRKLADEIQIGELEERIQARVREYMDKANHEYYLREQIHAIQEELGEDEDEEIAELRSRVAASKLPPAAREHVEKELKRLARSSVHAPESAVSQNYIEYMLELPWEVYDASNIDIKKARKVLEADHFGMEESSAA